MTPDLIVRGGLVSTIRVLLRTGPTWSSTRAGSNAWETSTRQRPANSTPAVSPCHPASPTCTATPTTPCWWSRGRSARSIRGVTTEVIGNCGHGCFPIRDSGLASRIIYGFDGSVPLGLVHAFGLPGAARAGRPRRQRHDLGPERAVAPRHRGARSPSGDGRRRDGHDPDCWRRVWKRALGATPRPWSTRPSRVRRRRRSRRWLVSRPGAAGFTPPTPGSGSSAPTRRWPRPFARPAPPASSSSFPISRREAAPTRRTAASTSWMRPGPTATTSPSICTPASTA